MEARKRGCAINSERNFGDPIPLPQSVRGRDHVERRGPADRHRNPVAFLEKVAPGKPIPQKLIDFASQFNFDEKPIKELSPSDNEEVPTVLPYVQGTDFSVSNSWGGAYGERCPFSSFASKVGGWGPFCPQDGGHVRWCGADNGWAVMDASTLATHAAYNTVCTDYSPPNYFGVAFVTKVTRADGGSTENEWAHYVPQGWWVQEYTKILTKCNWYGGCTRSLAGIKYDVLGNGSTFHWGGRWEGQTDWN